MILQHNTSLTVGDFNAIVDAEQNKTLFRVGGSVNKNTSVSGESAYLSFNANETKAIAIPLGYSSDDTLRIIGQVVGTLQLTVTHPVSGAQVLTLKGGSVTLNMRVSGISLTEMAGASASFTWSIVQITSANSEEFS